MAIKLSTAQRQTTYPCSYPADVLLQQHSRANHQNAKSILATRKRLDKTREQRLQDALVNVGSSDVRETLCAASCWFALAWRERDEAMMLSQLTFRESESLTKAGAAREETA